MAKEKISSQEIVEILAEQAGISKKSADEFLKSMFSSIEEALIAGESVKVKKFGTFKLKWNAPRKSVNVQTGEDILLSGYNKVSFVPDSQLKDSVNEPYAHLESVSLDEVAEQGNTEVKEDSYDQMEVFTDQANEIKGILSEIDSLSSEESSTEVSTSNEAKEEVANTDLKQNPVVKEELSESPSPTLKNETKAATVENSSVQTSVEEPKEETKKEEPVVEKVSTSADNTPPVTAVPPKQYTKIVEPKKKSKAWWIILILLILIIGAGFVAYYSSSCVQCWVKYDLLSETSREKLDNCTNSIASWFASDKDIDKVSSIPAESVVDSTEIVEPVDSLQILFDTKRVYPEYLGAERITNGSSLTRFALRYYGCRDFWVYIYEANRTRIKHPNEVAIGTLIRVPKVDPRLIDAENPRALKYAKELHDLYLK